MNLVVDIGNTRIKAAVFDKEELVRLWIFEEFTKTQVADIQSYFPISQAIVSDTGKSTSFEALEDIPYHVLSSELKLPIAIYYHTPNTLGADRLAGVVGAQTLFPDQNNLVIDMGTCITFDVVDKNGIYQGGAILPGVSMKFKALHTYTYKLPLLHIENDTVVDFIGKDTKSSIYSGVMNGTLCEIEGFVNKYQAVYTSLNVIFTGGDSIYFEKRVNFQNFVSANLLLIGLNKILNINEK